MQEKNTIQKYKFCSARSRKYNRYQQVNFAFILQVGCCLSKLTWHWFIHSCLFFTLYFFCFHIFWIWYFCIFLYFVFRKFGFAFSFVFCIFAIGFVLLCLCFYFFFFRNNFICLPCIIFIYFPLRPNMYFALFCISPFVQKSHFIVLYFCRLLVPASLRATPNAALQATSRNHTLLTLWTLTLGNTEDITSWATRKTSFFLSNYLTHLDSAI